jgi:hypothetical protein
MKRFPIPVVTTGSYIMSVLTTPLPNFLTPQGSVVVLVVCAVITVQFSVLKMVEVPEFWTMFPASAARCLEPLWFS